MLNSEGKGFTPVAISYSITPREYISALLSTLLVSAICSGDMYEGVPNVIPILVKPSSTACFEVAIPKSTSLTSPFFEINILAGLMSL